MALDIKIVEYFNFIVGDHASEGSKLLSLFAGAGVSLLAFKSVNIEPNCTRFTLFPNDSLKMINAAETAGLEPDGPHSAVLVKGDSDEPGDCAGIFEKISRAGINVIEGGGIADIKDGYGVILYLKQEDCEKASAALKM